MTNQLTPLQEFEALERQWADIFVRADAAALNDLLMDDFIYTSARGEVLHKPQYLQNLASGEVQMEGEEYSQIERQHEDVAVVTGVVMLQANYQGQDISGANLKNVISPAPLPSSMGILLATCDLEKRDLV